MCNMYVSKTQSPVYFQSELAKLSMWTLKFWSCQGKVCSPSKLLGSSAVEPAPSVLLVFCTVPAHSRNGMKCAPWRLALYVWQRKTKGSQVRSFRFCPGLVAGRKLPNSAILTSERLVAPSLGCFSPKPWLLLCKPRWRGLPSTYGVFFCAVHHEWKQSAAPDRGSPDLKRTHLKNVICSLRIHVLLVPA